MHDHPATLDEYSWPVCVTPRCNRQLWANEAGRWTCRPCEDATAARLAELPALFRRLDTTAALMRGARRSGGGGSGTKTPPIPPRLEVLSLVGPGGVAVRLQAIEDSWRQALGWGIEARSDGRRVFAAWRTDPARAVPEHAKFLLNNLPWAVERYESIGQDIDELRKLHGEMKAIADHEQRPGRVKIGLCPTLNDTGPCAAPLTARADSHRVHCGSCDSRWETLGEWRELRAAQDAVAAEAAGVAA